MIVRVDDHSAETREVQRVDCRVYDQRTESLRVGLDFSLLFGVAKAGPYLERTRKLSMDWDKSVHQMVAQYKELCSRFNAGAISLTAYEQRLSEIDQLWAEARGVRRSVEDITQTRAGQAFNELDSEAGRETSIDGEQAASAVENFSKKLGVQ